MSDLDLLSMPGTRSADVAARIRQDIVSGTLPFGGRLKLGELETRYETGQMPIREALRQLQGEGLVELAPNRGARVREVDVDFVRNLFDIRVAIEAMLTRRAAERIRRPDLEALEQAADTFERAVGGALDPLLAANRSFHGIINRVADNPEATEILKRNEQLITALWMRHGYGLERMSTAAADHRQIVAAMRAGDADSAACFAMAHAANARFELIGRMSKATEGR